MVHKRILLIGHSNIYSNYGAATSLRNHFEAFKKYEDFLFFHYYRINFVNVLALFKVSGIKGNLGILSATWLPYSGKCFEHKSPGLIKDFLYEYLPNLIFNIKSKYVLSKLEYTNPDIIHLNSITLTPLLCHLQKNSILSKCKIIMHVREMVDIEGLLRYKIDLNLVTYFVCIDFAVKERLLSETRLGIPSNKIFIQQNPFFSVNIVQKKIEKLFQDNIVSFCIAGSIGPDKGVDFVCEAFHRAQLDNCKLFVIGKLNSYALDIRRKFNSNANILWLGEIPRLAESGFFLKVDCLIRGEAFFCTGRTVYEALYADASVILPGSDDDLLNDCNLARFYEKVLVYKPRDIDSLSNVISVIASQKNKGKKNNLPPQGKSNFSAYISFFEKIYNFPNF